MSLKRMRVVFFAALMVVSPFLRSELVGAEGYQFLSDQEIMYYTPEDISTPNDIGNGPCYGGSSTTLSGSGTQEKMWNFFIGQGFTDVQVAGILGNAEAESGFWPMRRSSGSQYWGLFQWGRTLSEELATILEGAGLGKYSYDHSEYWSSGTNASKTIPPGDLDRIIAIELDYVMTTKPTGADWVTPLKGATSPQEAAEIFEIFFEGAVAGPPHYTEAEFQSIFGGDGYIEYYKPRLGEKFQHVGRRRDNAVKWYDNAIGGLGDPIEDSSGSVPGISGISWSGGWISGMPGMSKQAAQGSGETFGETFHGEGSWTTASGKANKILLHNTEGTGNGLAAYRREGGGFPAHFTIDLRKKEAYQHFSLNEPALAMAGDLTGSIQIEIVGFSTAKDTGKDYYLQNSQTFTDTEWDYLAVLLIAISQETGIPLTTSVDWANPTRLASTEAMKSYVGVLGHMHAYSNDHVDPGNIWGKVSAAIQRNPDGLATAFGGSNGGGNGCVDGWSAGDGTLVVGGITDPNQALPILQQFISDTNAKYSTSFPNLPSSATMGQVFDTPAAEGMSGESNCWLAKYCGQCVALSGWFVTNKTNYTFGSGNGGAVVKKLAAANGDLGTGKQPQPYSIFSYGEGTKENPGHTGVVLGVFEDGSFMTIENNMGSGKRLQVRTRKLDDGHDWSFAYVGDKLK